MALSSHENMLIFNWLIWLDFSTTKPGPVISFDHRRQTVLDHRRAVCHPDWPAVTL